MTTSDPAHQPRPGPARRPIERGAITLASIIFAISSIAAAGLAVDGGRKLNGLAQARELADNAARVGAQKVDVDTYRSTGRPALLPGEAAAAANAYLAAHGRTGTVSVNGTTITVTVAFDVNTRFLPGPMHVRAEGLATAENGVTTAVVGP